MPSRTIKFEKTAVIGIAMGFIVWSLAFIYRSSILAIDGKRYFCLFDDAMISMRYAWNLAHGFGLVWNPGERVEGYSNLLMTVLMALPTLIPDKSSAVLVVQLAGVLTMLGIAFLNRSLVEYILPDTLIEDRASTRVLAFFCGLAYFPLAHWTLLGMETGLLTLLLLFALLAAFRYMHSHDPKHLLAMSCSLGMAFLARNDSIIPATIIWAYVILDTRLALVDTKRLSPTLLSLGIFLLFIIGQMVFRFTYYGQLMPNTFLLKLTGMPLAIRIQNGLGYVTPFMKQMVPTLILSFIGLQATGRKRGLLLVALTGLAISYQVYIGGDAWMYWRMLAGFIPPMTLLLVGAATILVQKLCRTQIHRPPGLWYRIISRPGIGETIKVVIVLSGLVSANWFFLQDISLQRKLSAVKDNTVNVNLAVALSAVTTSDASVGVLWAGSIPYYTGRPAIDFLGKADRYIASLPADISGDVGWLGMTSVPGHNKYDLTYSIQTLLPTYVQRFHWGGQDLRDWVDNKYVRVRYAGIQFALLRDSPTVRWKELHIRTP